MWQSIITTIASVFTKETLASIGNAILASQVRSNFRRAIRDLVEDEIARALRQHNIAESNSVAYNKKYKSRLKEEIRARFDAMLMK